MLADAGAFQGFDAHDPLAAPFDHVVGVDAVEIRPDILDPLVGQGEPALKLGFLLVRVRILDTEMAHAGSQHVPQQIAAELRDIPPGQVHVPQPALVIQILRIRPFDGHRTREGPRRQDLHRVAIAIEQDALAQPLVVGPGGFLLEIGQKGLARCPHGLGAPHEGAGEGAVGCHALIRQGGGVDVGLFLHVGHALPLVAVKFVRRQRPVIRPARSCPRRPGISPRCNSRSRR